LIRLPFAVGRSQKLPAKTNFGFRDLGVAQCLLELGRPALALETYRESVTTFEEIASETNSNRYPRSGLASAYSGLADVYSALASPKNLSRSQARAYWQQPHSAGEKSLSLWNEKEKRGELESGERDRAQQATQCIANAQAQLRRRGNRTCAYPPHSKTIWNSTRGTHPDFHLSVPLSRIEVTALSGAI
jgi:hypothetical protein